MAQDFYSIFEVGNSDKGIGSVDRGGISLAAIKELYKELLDAKAEIAELKKIISTNK